MNKKYSEIKIGILGGGQLGRMLAIESANLGIHPYFLDKSDDYPAAKLSARFKVGEITNYDDVMQFGESMDVISIEIENVNTEALSTLQTKGIKVFPSPQVIQLIQDKGVQKAFYKTHDLPTSDFQLFDDANAIRQSIQEGNLSLPFVQKLRKGGYDGKGVLLVKETKDLERLFDAPSVVEDLARIDKELAVIVARNENGEVKCFPTVEMVFDPEANLVDYLKCPAKLASETEKQCIHFASILADKLDLVGLLAIEFFLTKDGDILINEMAPRTHNSGHLFTEQCVTSQFEQHLRTLVNLPLGSTEISGYGAMVNVLGKADYEGTFDDSMFDELLKMADVHPHIYAKKISKPKRKMGHINILADTEEGLNSKITKVKSILLQ